MKEKTLCRLRWIAAVLMIISAALSAIACVLGGDRIRFFDVAVAAMFATLWASDA